MKTLLTLEVDFNPEITNAESVALASDRLLETALSTPDVLDEHGHPTFSPFSVAGEFDDYWDEDPIHALADWQEAVATNGTRLGYWAWVASERDADETQEDAA